MERAQFLCGVLERFGGYTMSTLLAEDARLLRILKIESMGRKEEDEYGQ